MSTSEGRTCITHHVVHKTVKQAQRTHCSGMKFYLLLVCHTLRGGQRSIRAIKSCQIFNSVHKRMSLLQKIMSKKNKLKLATGKWSLKYPWLSSQGIYFHQKMFLIFWRFPNAGIFLVPSSRVCSAGLIWDFWIMFSSLKLVLRLMLGYIGNNRFWVISLLIALFTLLIWRGIFQIQQLLQLQILKCTNIKF